MHPGKAYGLISGALTAALAAAGMPAAGTELPVPCAPCTLTGSGPLVWISSGVATLAGDATHMIVNVGTSTQPNAVLNWQSFNISADGSVQFVQPTATAIALNRIYQADPSRIFGNLSANGQVYLINQNGILFGNPDGTPMQLNVQSLIASTLTMSDTAISNGILAPISGDQAAFTGSTGAIQVNAGATLKSADGGRIALFAPTVTNGGHIESPDGQALLAAGKSIYLQSSDDPNLRGLLVEVDQGGTVANTGSVLTQLGNITLVGLAVNQSGRLTATTSVTKGGSISLQARDTVGVQVQSGGRHVPLATRTGTVEFGSGSVTEVALQTNNGETAIDDQPQPVSAIAVDARQVHMATGSQILAHGGTVAMTAELNPALAGQAQPNAADVSVQLDAGSTIDVSGLSVDVPMERNQVTVQLRGNELRDDPQQRDGVLRGQTIVVDGRVGTPLADTSGYVAGANARTVTERLGNGGSVTLLSQGAATVAAGATINIAGGSVNYLPGDINTTKLIGANGQVYDIGSAPANVTYVGLYGPSGSNANKWGATPEYAGVLGSNVVPGYTQGLDAGSLQVSARTIVLAGDILAQTQPGFYQTSPASLPLTGQLIIGLPTGKSGGGLTDFAAPSLWLGDAPPQGAADMALPLARLNASGVGRFALYSNGRITLPAGAAYQLTSGTQISVTAPRIDLQSSLTDHGGSLTVQSTNVDPNAALASAPGVTVASGGTLDFSGAWTNDYNSSGNPSIRFLNGGSVNLGTNAVGGVLALGDGARLDVSGGAAANVAGALATGNGGGITLNSSGLDSTMSLGYGLTLQGYAVAGGKGGSLTISAPSVAITGYSSITPDDLIFGNQQVSSATSSLALDNTMFARGGFATYGINANQGNLEVLGGTQLQVQVATRQLHDGYLAQASGTPLLGMTSVGYLPDFQRQTASLTLSANLVSDTYRGQLRIDQDALVAVEPTGSVTLQSTGGNLFVDGTVKALGGTISLTARQLGSQVFDPTFSLWLGSHSVVDVSGDVASSPDGNGNTELSVLNAGSITAVSAGYLVADQGSLLRAAGASATGDLQTVGYARHLYDRAGGHQQAVGSSGGIINLRSADGSVLLAAFDGHAGRPGYTAGELNLLVDRSLRTGLVSSSASGFPVTPSLISIGSSVAAQASPIAFGGALPTATYNGLLGISTDQISASGVDAINFRADQIHFANTSPVNLSLARQVTLTGQQYIADATRAVLISAPSVSLQSPISAAGGTALAGLAKLTVQASNIDLVGGMTYSGFAGVELDSSGDIRLRGAPSLGALATNGLLTLEADRIFPATMTSFTLSAADPTAGIGTVQILSNGKPTNTADGLLSAGGSITINAGNIEQQGVLEAPLGTIALNARNTLTLGAGSLTSVHASAAQILLGRTVNLADWYYSAAGSAGLGASDQIYGANRQTIPAKGITMSASSLNVAKDATVDYSGGGDALAWEQIPGPGGSSDLLSVANAGGMFAILPTAAGYGPVDPAEYAQWGLTPGAAVTLYQPANGLPAGTYAILPPRYALMAGAYLVKRTTGFTNMDPTQSVQLTDGSIVVAGTNTFLNTGLQSGATTGFQVYNGSYANQLAEYHLTSANSYLPTRAAQLGLTAPSLPQDAGSLSLTGQGTLLLDGTFKGSAASGGKASQVDVSAANLAVVTQVDPASQATQITAANLEALGAGSLLLGGKRTRASGGTTIAVSAGSVSVGDGVALALPELMLVANNNVTVGTNAQLTASGASTAQGTTYLLTGDSARLLLSNAKGAQVLATYATGAIPGQRGIVTTGAGSVLTSSGSLVLDGAKDLVLGGEIAAAAASTVSLASSLVTLGDGAAPGTGGLVLTSADLAKLASVDLSLKGRTGIDVSSAVMVNASNLVLDAPVVLGQLATGGDVAAFNSSGSLVIRNSSGTVGAAAAPAQLGALDLSGNNILVDGSAVALAGFSTTQVNANSSLVGKGTASLNYQGDLAVSTPLFTLADGANLNVTGVTAGSRFRLDSPASATPVDSTGIGGALVITADTVEQFGNIALHAGTVDLVGAHGVTLGSGSRTSVAGYDVVMPGLTTPVTAGRVSLHASSGDVLVQSGATVDVSGSAGGGDAGLLALVADSGQVGIDSGATLEGSVSQAGAQSGSLSLDARSLANGDFSSLNTHLNAAAFNGVRSFRFSGTTPSVDLAAGTVLNLKGFNLTVDQGGINIAGQVNVANAAGAALLGLYARDTVHVASTGALSATSQAKGTTEAEIDLYSNSGGITVDGGATLAASAPDSTLSTGGGLVHYRLTQDQVAAGGFSVAAGVGSSGTRQLVEGYRAYNLADGLIDTETLANAGNPVYQNAAAFMSSAPVAGLKAAGFEVTPGVELTSASDMTLASPWNLAQWRFGGEPGVLTLRAGGSLSFAESLSDGFATAVPSDALRSDRSWSYNLVAGADLGSADVLRTSRQSTNAVLAVNPDVLVRTGTGDIHVASAGDVALLGNVTPDDPYGQGVIYTAGRSAGLELDRPTYGTLASKYLPVDGGSLSINAGRDIIGSPSTNEYAQFFVEWYRRQPDQGTEAAGMWVNYDAFQQNFAAFGGGDLSLTAGRDLVRVAAAVPTTAYFDSTTATTRYYGSGSLSATAGRDIASGMYLVSSGSGTINAGGSITATSKGQFGNSPYGTVLAAMDSHYNVHARGDIALGSIVNPTSINEVNQADSEFDFFLSYSPTASVALQSIAGNIQLQNNGSNAVKADVSGLITLSSPKDLSVYPGSLAATALRGDLKIAGSMYLAPSPSGNLQLAAWGNLLNAGGEVSLSDIDPASLPSLSNPAVDALYLESIHTNSSGSLAHAVPSPHVGDTATAALIAATGDLSGGFWFINRPGLVFAGRDLFDLRYNGENLAATDVTRIIAGRDIRFSTASTNYGINLAGPGDLSVVAGRNIDLGPSFGIVTEGNLVNSGLADVGANITVMAGVAGDIDTTLANIPGDKTIADLFLALRTAGRDVARGLAADFQPGLDAIEMVFPAAQAAGQQGDLTMVQSRIYTLDGGDINLVVPHGEVNVGVAQAAAGGVTKKPSQLGIVAQKSGAVRAFVDGDFLVNSSRVFTLGGGDILIWSSNGNIDAGRGAKTTISAPEPTITIDPQGNVQQNFGAAIAGSGIRGILAVKDVAPGDVDLFAPRGFVSAGDAGIGSAGNVTIAAVRVIGADNINFGGSAVGVPVDTGGLGASLASVSAASSSATNAATNSAGTGSNDQGKTPLASEALSWLEVFVLGLGEDTCRQDDLDCLKRQKKSLN